MKCCFSSRLFYDNMTFIRGTKEAKEKNGKNNTRKRNEVKNYLFKWKIQNQSHHFMWTIFKIGWIGHFDDLRVEICGGTQGTYGIEISTPSTYRFSNDHIALSHRSWADDKSLFVNTAKITTNKNENENSNKENVKIFRIESARIYYSVRGTDVIYYIRFLLYLLASGDGVAHTIPSTSRCVINQ